LNIPVDVIVSFDDSGNINPLYISYTDNHNVNHTYKIDNIKEVKNERFAGIYTMLFNCTIIKDGIAEDIQLRYIIKDMRWVLVSG
jgi:hypothetical protein